MTNGLTLKYLPVRILRKLLGAEAKSGRMPKGYIDYFDQEGNDHILKRLNGYSGGGYMLSKWGCCEYARVNYDYVNGKHLTLSDYWAMARRRLLVPTDQKAVSSLYNNAGVFPDDEQTHKRFSRKALQDCQLIDILCSVVKEEVSMKQYWSSAMIVNLNAYLAPWMFNNPWTQWLRGKRVLVVHPFVESIRRQYETRRKHLFANPDVLPEFGDLMTIKAVQSAGGEKPPFDDWFEALHYMEQEIDRHDYDVAIIGCGAYGMSLAAHVKRQGKVGIHLAGWTQMLFGVYGNRWSARDSQYAKYINNYWIRPGENERIERADSIENACYW